MLPWTLPSCPVQRAHRAAGALQPTPIAAPAPRPRAHGASPICRAHPEGQVMPTLWRRAACCMIAGDARSDCSWVHRIFGPLSAQRPCDAAVQSSAIDQDLMRSSSMLREAAGAGLEQQMQAPSQPATHAPGQPTPRPSGVSAVSWQQWMSYFQSCDAAADRVAEMGILLKVCAGLYTTGLLCAHSASNNSRSLAVQDRGSVVCPPSAHGSIHCNV